MPTPVKYYNEDIRDAYKMIEAAADKKLLSTLPDDLRPTYESVFFGSNDADDVYLRRLVKAADKLSALIKCIEEENAGNGEFRTAKKTIQDSVDNMSAQMPEVRDFCKEFLPAYGSTLDELL
jgi:5'-deoxynucleotidase